MVGHCREAVGSRAYRFLSPGFQFRPGSRDVSRLVSVGLTNVPNFSMPALTGERWALVASVTDSAAGTIRIDGRGAARGWSAGIVWLDIRLSRADRVVHTDTLGVVVLDAQAAAEEALRAVAPEPGLGQRRIWTSDREVLDALCLRELGAERHAAAVLGLNPGLAALGPILPAGAGILLPEALAAQTAAVATPVRLWGAGA